MTGEKEHKEKWLWLEFISTILKIFEEATLKSSQ